MRILVHDLSGHPFQLELSRGLAGRGHQVLHLFSAEFVTGKGDTTVPPELAENLDIRAVPGQGEFDKYNVPKRVLSEIRYGRAVADQIRTFRADVALTSNDPLISKHFIASAVEDAGTRWVIWQQDMIHHTLLELGLPGPLPRLLSQGGLTADTRLMARADHVVCITDQFREELTGAGVDPQKLTVIENWAPLGEIAPIHRPTPWQLENGLGNVPLVMYSGTLGMKHDPLSLVAVARALRERDVAARVVVISEGVGADAIRDAVGEQLLDNIIVLDYQPYERLGEVLSSAEVLIALLEPQASLMSVPSKVASYLASGRATIGAMPAENAAALALVHSGGGFVTPPGDHDAIANQVIDLLLLPEADRDVLGCNARAYAEKTYGLDPILDRFEQVLSP